jgi:hypothetical protein
MYKEKCGKYLFIYRKNAMGKYDVFLKVEPNGMFSGIIIK